MASLKLSLSAFCYYDGFARQITRIQICKLLFLSFKLALSGHDGPWYLEKTNHIPEEYHKPLGLEPLIVSPRSESNDVGSVILHPVIEILTRLNYNK